MTIVNSEYPSVIIIVYSVIAYALNRIDYRYRLSSDVTVRELGSFPKLRPSYLEVRPGVGLLGSEIPVAGPYVTSEPSPLPAYGASRRRQKNRRRRRQLKVSSEL